MRPLLLGALGLAFVLAACGGPDRAATPAGNPTQADVRAAGAAYLREVRAEVVSVRIEENHVGLYVRGVPEWTYDQFVEYLPLAAETARAMLARWPSVADVDICADGPWLPRDDYADFATASRVQVYRDRLDRLPARFTDPAQVMRAGGTERTVDYYLDPKIVTGSARYRTEIRESVATASPS